MNVAWLFWFLWSVSFANPIDDPSKYADGLLVIVSSSKKKDDAQNIYSKVLALEGLTPIRLNSGHFKGLMPCWEIIAVPAKDSKAAKVISKKLKAHKVSNYIKNPGAYVGPNERLDAMCSTSNDSVGPNNSRFGLKMDTGLDVYMPLILKPEIRDAVLQQRYTQKATSNSYETWIDELNNNTIESFHKGQKWDAYGVTSSQKQECSISGFVVMTRGVPHFGIFEQGEELTEPECGDPWVYAKLDCPQITSKEAEQRFVLYPKGSGYTLNAVDSNAWQDAELSAKQNQDAQVQKMLSEAEEWSQSQDMPLQTSVRVTKVADTDSKLSVVEMSFITGTGNNECGGEDHNTTVSAIYREQTRVTEFVNTQYTPILGVIELKSGSVVTVKRMDYGDLVMLDHTGNVLTALPKGFCDCGC